MIKGRKLSEDNSLKEYKNSAKAAIEIAGMPKRNENFAASPLSQPDTSAVEIVIPDLETPGTIAKAWEKPINKLFEYLWFFKFLWPFFELSATYIKKAINKETNAIDKFERRKLSKKLGKKIFIAPPTNTIGMVPIKIDLNNFSCIKWSTIFLDKFIFDLKISFLKYQIKAKTLPNWIIADKEGPGSSIPKKRDMTFKWAVLLTGINSVKPWIKPYKINLIYSKKFRSLNSLIAI